MCTERHDVDYDDDAFQNCRIGGSVNLFTIIDIASNTETYRLSASAALFTIIDTARPEDAVDDAFIKTPELQ